MIRRIDAAALRDDLRSGRRRLGVWGLGYLGFSTMAYFARSGVACIGTDPMDDRIKAVNRGIPSIPNLDLWIGFDARPLAASGLMRASQDWKELVREDVAAHIVAVPTERGGKPFDEPLRDVIEKLCEYRHVPTDRPPVVIIESTLTPRRIDQLVVPLFEEAGLRVGEAVLVGVAPRRDWFISPEKTLKTLPRVVGGTTEETTGCLVEVLGLVSDHIMPAQDHRHAEVVKSVENAYRLMDIALANQLSLAYPDLDMREILRLVGTKWNMETYYPSFGTGGYCIPVAPQYVLEGAMHPEELGLLRLAYESDRQQPVRVAQSLIRRGIRRVGILGFSYKGDLKVHSLTPTIPIYRALRAAGVEVKIHDPYFTVDELREYCDPAVETFRFPEGLGQFEAIVIVAGHTVYRAVRAVEILEGLGACRLILDNARVWRDIPFEGVEYHVAGDRGWLGHA
jgi:nucleotide sugar dehydrogenase